MNELAPYRAKRDFRRTPEPEGAAATRTGARFVVHKHAATRLHYDLRLEIGGVLKSWAVTKGPSLDPKVKRLAVHVEDHPLSYTEFEGWIPKGQYGGGAMIVWDRGTWVPLGDLENDYQRGELKFRLDGEKLQGGWALVRLKGTSDVDKGWLLIKERDIFAAPSAQADVTGEAPLSVLSGLSTEAIEAEHADDGRERKPLARKRRRKQHPERLAGAKRAVQPEVPGASASLPRGRAARGHGMDSRNQVRRLPHALPAGRRRGAAPHAQRSRLDRPLRAGGRVVRGAPLPAGHDRWGTLRPERQGA